MVPMNDLYVFQRVIGAGKGVFRGCDSRRVIKRYLVYRYDLAASVPRT